MAPPQRPGVTKYALDGFSEKLANVLEERLARIRQYVDEDKACTRDELARFIWGTARSVRSTIRPESNDKQREAWQSAKGMLKEIIDFNTFRPQQFSAQCVKQVLEKKTAEVIDNYRNYVITGEIRTRWFPPKLLGETDEILCIDKPCMYTCTYGGSADDTSSPPRAYAESASALLNGEKAEIQIHEYLALKFNYETAVGTREWWKTEEKWLTCTCGTCEYCSCTQSGCCNRLDKETSGVMIVAKTKKGFGEIRRQFASEHSIEKGGTEKYYMALAHGEVKLPEAGADDVRSKYWKHSLSDSGRGRIEVTMKWSREERKSLPYDAGSGPSGSESPQWALTLYEPVAWFMDKTGECKFTLCFVQIVTGRTHQIRFHLAEVGHPLVGDPTYGAPVADREWCKRVFLHSYQTKFREPQTLRWFEATSPLPPDLGQVLCGLVLDHNKEMEEPLLSRRHHPHLNKFLKQYDPQKQLLWTNDEIRSADALKAAEGQIEKINQKYAWKENSWNNDSWTNSDNSWNSGGNNGGKSNSWSDDKWKSNNSWGSGDWKSSDQKQGGWNQNSWKEEKKQEQEEDEDAWGGWKEPEKPEKDQNADKAEEPPAKKAKTEDGAAEPKPTTPPAAGDGAAAPAKSWKRMESKRQAGVFYYFCEATGETQVEPPPPWEKRQSRSQAGVFYYWNPLTNSTSVEKPAV